MYCAKAFQSGSNCSSFVSFFIGGCSVSSRWGVPPVSSVVCVAVVLFGVGGCGGGGIVWSVSVGSCVIELAVGWAVEVVDE
eukprot:4871750-Prorocentrum_lima.AAC.1